MFKRLLILSNKYKIIRGVVSYGIIWPFACLAEQTFIEKRSFRNYDWMKCVRFSLFGGLFMGPTLYVWFRLAEVMWPKRNFKTTICKIFTESISHDPMSISTFLYTMPLMEGKTMEEAKNEVRRKFFETYKVSLVFWPLIQVVNFTYVPVHNQVVYVACFSLIWTTFLSHKLHLRDVVSSTDQKQST